ncbi:MAG: hypothetical protein WBZ36_31360, partial [Candidatus Nitrosopolaris sp.]
ANSRIDTTQGTDMTKRLIATELTNAINSTAANSNAPSQLLHQATRSLLTIRPFALAFLLQRQHVPS